MASPTPKTEPTEAMRTEDLDTSLDADPDVDMAQAPVPTAAGPSSSEATILQTDGPGDSQAKDGPENAAAGASTAAATQAQGEMRQEALDLSLQEARVPMRKDVSLREFLSRMDDYAPVIPDAVTFHALTLAGLPPPPLSSLNPSATNPPSSAPAPSQSQSQPQANGTTTQPPTNGSAQHPLPSGSDDTTPLPLARLLALATQKFVADIAADAYQYSRMRSGTLTSNTLSALSNPGAPGPSGAPAGAAAGTAPAGGAAGAAAAGSKQAGQHVLGVQRPGFGGGGQGGGQGRTVLTMEDLGMAVGEYGVNVKRGEFYR